jgi:hypothetical protein
MAEQTATDIKTPVRYDKQHADTLSSSELRDYLALCITSFENIEAERDAYKEACKGYEHVIDAQAEKEFLEMTRSVANGVINGLLKEKTELKARVTELEGKLAAAERVIRHYQNPKNWTDEDYATYHQLDVTGKCTYLGADNGPDKANEYLEANDGD